MSSEQPKNREEAEGLLGDIAAQSNTLQLLTAAMNSRLEEIRAEHQPAINELNDVIADNRARLEEWADSARDDWGDAKSIELLHGAIGFRLTPPRLALLARSTWKKVLEKLKSSAKLAAYIRVKEEPNKELILEHIRDGTISSQDRARIGVTADQEEKFFIDLKD